MEKYLKIEDGWIKDCDNKIEGHLNIPEGITDIQMYSFTECNKLTSVTFPKTLRAIGCEMFYRCENLTDIFVHPENESFKSINGNLYTKNGDTIMRYANGKKDRIFVVPDHVKYIGGDSFCDAKHLTEIVLPENIHRIEGEAFSRCTSLYKINFPDNLISIGEYVFNKCNEFKTPKGDFLILYIDEHGTYWERERFNLVHCIEGDTISTSRKIKVGYGYGIQYYDQIQKLYDTFMRPPSYVYGEKYVFAKIKPCGKIKKDKYGDYACSDAKIEKIFNWKEVLELLNKQGEINEK